ncbi:MAG: hypothetical protein NUW06_04030 [Candidatus Acetothermia bacterium]|jgi:hypothetical protein|nr:hypothetical protein [Candidatus Acetothermia bacterium]MDH7505118.1 hypothetical protein [Candidatus Acetothermia bacterium]
MREIGLALVLVLAVHLPSAASGDWQGTTEFKALSNINGIAEEYLDLVSELNLRPPFAGLNLKASATLEEAISNVHQVKIGDLVKALEGLEAIRKDVRSIEPGKIKENLRAEWLTWLEAITRLLESGRLDEAVEELRDFREAVSSAYVAKKLTRKDDANKLRGKAKTAIRNINNIEGLKEDTIDLTCAPFAASSETDCIPAAFAELLNGNLDVAKAAADRGENSRAIRQLTEFIRLVEDGYGEGLIISAEADSLISRAETIMGKIDKSKRARDLNFRMATTIGGIGLAWTVDGGSALFPVPGKDKQDFALGFAAAFEGKGFDLQLALEHQELDFMERWSREDDKLVDQLEVAMELELGEVELAQSLGYERTLFPEAIAKEVEISRVEVVKRELLRLREEIKSCPSLPQEIKDELVERKGNKLGKALQALIDGQRQKAVDYLLDFLELIERRRREGKITRDDAEWLISEVRGILPRERSRIISGTMGAEFALSLLDLEIGGTGTLKAFPTETKKDERDIAFAVGFEAERGRLSLAGSTAWQRKLFPNDPAKDELSQDWEGTATFEREGFKARGSLEAKAIIYPNSSAKDYTVRAQDLKLEWALARADLTLSWEREATNYPNAPEKETLVEGLGLVLEFAEPGFTLDLEREATTYPLAPAKDKLAWSAEFKLAKGIAPGLTLKLAASFVAESYPNEPAKDKLTAGLELTLEQKF